MLVYTSAPGGVLPGFWGGGVPYGSHDPDPVNILFSIRFFRPDPQNLCLISNQFQHCYPIQAMSYCFRRFIIEWYCFKILLRHTEYTNIRVSGLLSLLLLLLLLIV